MSHFRIRLLLLFAGVGLNTFCYGQIKVEVYVIPQNYRGKIVVVYGRPFGSDSRFSNDTVYYQIPNDGIAIVSNKINTNLEKSCFITFDNLGTRKEFPLQDTKSFFESADSVRNKNEVGIIIFGTIGSCNFSDKTPFCYSDFYVGTFNEMKDYYTPDKATIFNELLERKARWR